MLIGARYVTTKPNQREEHEKHKSVKWYKQNSQK